MFIVGLFEFILKSSLSFLGIYLIAHQIWEDLGLYFLKYCFTPSFIFLPDGIPQVSEVLFIFLHSIFFLFFTLDLLNFPVLKLDDFFFLLAQICYRAPLEILFQLLYYLNLEFLFDCCVFSFFPRE